MPPKRSPRRSSLNLQHQLHYATTKEECHTILGAHAKKLVVFIFIAEYCPHSVELKVHLESLAKEDQHVVLVIIDVDDAQDLIPFYSLYAVPSFYFFKNHEEIGTQVGGDYAKLRTCIRKFKRMKEIE
ncbi:thioredoxin [Echinococcus multilocularis]|uniref:Thioredoxin n=1 Tax=Echinococcus multilocularis TaxID=6211 RepID=A0A068Y3R4_ECHMU|nr:thioredoxin [Echinococcus multilocularis]